MATVTICIPAYRTGEAIGATLASALGQDHTDVRVEVAVEPADQDTARACARFADDPRLRVVVNDEVLGWAHNIRRLLQRVQTPLFTILPHDDRYELDYLRRLHATLDEHPDAVVAYSDMQRFGHASTRKFVAIERGDAASRIFSFFLAGAEAVPWRGLTRSAVLDGARFPVNPFDSYAVECEWAGHLLVQGQAIRVPLPLYWKRCYGSEGTNVSRRWKTDLDAGRRRAAFDHHSRAMRRLAEAAAAEEVRQRAIDTACELAMMQRSLVIVSRTEAEALALHRQLARIEQRLTTLRPDHRAALATQVEAIRSVPEQRRLGGPAARRPYRRPCGEQHRRRGQPAP